MNTAQSHEVTLWLAEARLLHSAVSVQEDKETQALPAAKELDKEPERHELS